MSPNEKLLLLVEDSKDDASLIRSALAESHFKARIIHVKDGAEALEYIFAKSAFKDRTLPHWILLDLKLPKVHGLEVLKQLRTSKESAKIPVVVFTSSKEEKDVVESYRLNVNSYLQKPIDYDEFEDLVKRLALYWNSLNHFPPSWEKVSFSR